MTAAVCDIGNTKWTAYSLALLASVTLQPGYAQDALHTSAVALTCGGKHFALSTTWHRGTPMRFVWDQQRLTAGDGKTVDLLDPPVASHPGGLPAAVTGWQCVAGGGGDVVVLAYACVSDSSAACNGQREWFHLVSPAGVRLDAGYKPQDGRLDKLVDELGIAKTMRDGLSLQEVIK